MRPAIFDEADKSPLIHAVEERDHLLERLVELNRAVKRLQSGEPCSYMLVGGCAIATSVSISNAMARPIFELELFQTEKKLNELQMKLAMAEKALS
jgi:hypothetical protein